MPRAPPPLPAGTGTRDAMSTLPDALGTVSELSDSVSSVMIVETDATVTSSFDMPRTSRTSSVAIRRQQLFGVELRSTAHTASPRASMPSTATENKTTTTTSTPTPVLRPSQRQTASTNVSSPPPPPRQNGASIAAGSYLVLYEVPQSIRGQAVAVFAHLHHIPLSRRRVNPLLGTSPSGTSSLLPRLEDGVTVVHGWITILKYLAWKFLPSASTFYPVPNPASFATSSSFAPSVTSLTIDSLLESLSALPLTLDYLSHVFLHTAPRNDHRGLMARVQHSFDAHGELVHAPWQTMTTRTPQQAHTQTTRGNDNSTTTARPSTRDALQDSQERHVRSLRTALLDLQARLAERNPRLTVEQSLAYLRGATATPPTPAPFTTPPPAIDPDFVFLLGSRQPTLADFVVYFWLHQLSLLHAFMPPLAPHMHAALFVFAEKMTRFTAPHVHELTNLRRGEHVLLARHPLLQAHSDTKPKEDFDEPTDANNSTRPTSALAAALSAPRGVVPRLTDANQVCANSTRPGASSLAVEDVPDLMEYVELISQVRSRAAPPEGHPSPPGLAAPISAGITPPSTPPPPPPPAQQQRKSPAANGASASSLSLSRPLTQRLIDTVDTAAVYWRQVSAEEGVRLLVPAATPTQEQLVYQTMAVATFPVSASVLMSFLWSMDFYHLLDPVRVLDSRELAPHPTSTRAKYSYLSLELTLSSEAAIRCEADEQAANARSKPPPPPPLPSIIPAAAAPLPIPKLANSRLDFLLLSSWTRLLDGTYALLHQSVMQEEINAPRKWTKKCVRASAGGTAATLAGAESSSPIGGVSGWVLKPCQISGVGPGVQVHFVTYTEFPTRMPSWTGGELEQRAVATLVALRARLRSLMASHPMLQTAGEGVQVQQRPHAQTLHIRMSQAVPLSLVDAVTAHGVQSVPHPRDAKNADKKSSS